MFGIKKIDGIVFKAFIGPLIFTFIISEFVFLMQFLWKYIDDLVGKGLEFDLILQLLMLFSFKVLPLALPLSILLASAMTMGNFGENNEIVAAKASGISTLRFMGSLIFFVSILAVGAYFFSNKVLPYTNLKFMTLLMDIRKHKPALDIKEGVFYKGINGYTMKIGKKSPNNTSIYDVIMYDHSTGYGNDLIIMADKGEMNLSADQRYMIFELFDGRQYQETRKRTKDYQKAYEQNVVEFKYFRKIFDLKEFKLNRGDGSLFKGYHEMLDSKQLRFEIDSIQKDIDKVPSIIRDYYGNYFIFSQKKIDTLPEISNINLVPDTIGYENVVGLDGPDKEVIHGALNNLQSILSYISMQKSDIEMKKYHKQKFEVELHKKFMLSFTCIILLLIGSSMGAIVRKGGLGMPIIISASFYMIFHILNMIGDKLAYSAVVSPGLGAWLPTVVLFPIAIWLSYKATNDSSMMKKETYQKIFKIIFPKKWRSSNEESRNGN